MSLLSWVSVGYLPWPSGAAKNEEEAAQNCVWEQKSALFPPKNGPAVSLSLPWPNCTMFSQITFETYISPFFSRTGTVWGARFLFHSQSQSLQLNTKLDLLGFQRMLTNWLLRSWKQKLCLEKEYQSSHLGESHKTCQDYLRVTFHHKSKEKYDMTFHFKEIIPIFRTIIFVCIVLHCLHCVALFALCCIVCIATLL